MKIFLAATLMAALFGCASSGPKIDAEQLSEIRKGQTTASEIYKQFGRPGFLSKNMDGTQTAVYVHTADSGGSVVGALTGTAETVTFYFDETGVLSDYKYTPSGAARTAPETAAKSAQPATTAAASAVGSAPESIPAAQSGGVKTAPGAPAKPAQGTSSTPYLWDILRSSTSKDPRSP